MANNYLDKNGLAYFWKKIDTKIQHFIDITATYNSDYTEGTFIVDDPAQAYKYFDEERLVVLVEDDVEYEAYHSNTQNREWVAVKENMIITLHVATISTSVISGTITITYVGGSSAEYGTIELTASTMTSSGTVSGDTLYKTTFNAGTHRHIKFLFYSVNKNGISKFSIQFLKQGTASTLTDTINISNTNLNNYVEVELQDKFYILRLASGKVNTALPLNSLADFERIQLCLYLTSDTTSSDSITIRYRLGD